MAAALAWGIACLFLILPAWAGEIIGNTYVGEKQGNIEVVSPDGKWEIHDREGNSNQIVELLLKERMGGARPRMLFFGLPKLVAMDALLQSFRKSGESQGMELGPIELKTFGGKSVATYTASMSANNQRITTTFYLLEGATAFFFVSAASPASAHESARRLFDDVVEKLKY